MCQGPQRLGGSLGSASLRHLGPQEAAAQAAERRARDDARCPSAAIAAGEKLVIDLLDDDSGDEGPGVSKASGLTRFQQGARAGSCDQVSVPVHKGTATPGVVTATAQLGKFTGQEVPGYSGRVGSRSAAGKGVPAGPRAAVGGVLCEPDKSTAGTAVKFSSKARKAAPDVRKVDDVVDLVHSPCDMCCGRQNTAAARASGCQHRTVDLVGGDVDFLMESEVSAPSKRIRGVAQTQSDAENSLGTDKDKRFIDLT